MAEPENRVAEWSGPLYAVRCRVLGKQKHSIYCKTS